MHPKDFQFPQTATVTWTPNRPKKTHVDRAELRYSVRPGQEKSSCADMFNILLVQEACAGTKTGGEPTG